MWYVAILLFAQKNRVHKHRVKCETCNVLFNAKSAMECYDKAGDWAKEHCKDSLFHFIGVRNLMTLGSKRPKDGDEVGGCFFDKFDVWKKRQELVPPKEKLSAIQLEQNRDTPLCELMTPQQLSCLFEVVGQERKGKSKTT